MKSVSEPREDSPVPTADGEFGRGFSDTRDRAGEEGPQSAYQHQVYEKAPLAYLNFDTRGRILDFNVAASLLLGVNRERDLRRPLGDFVIPRHRRRLMKHVRDSLGSSAPVVTRLVLRAQGDNATVGEVELNTRPESEAEVYRTLLLPVSGNGATAAWPGDDAKFRALVENSTEVICIGAPDGTVFYTTPSVKRVLGYDPASWFGRNALEVMPPEYAAQARIALRELARSPTGTVIRLITQVRHFDGSWRWVEGILTNLIGEPAIGGIVCNYRDITDARSAEEAVRASEQRYRLLAESLPQMISIRDEKGNIEYCNSHWCEYRGTDPTRPIIHDWKDGILPEDRAALQAPPLVDGEPQPWEAECRVRRATDGMLRWHSVRVIPLPRQGKGPTRYLAIATDIHERKQAEQERERLLCQLERERSELAVQYAVVRVLAAAATLEDAAPRLLAAFCDQLDWQAGALWTLNCPGTRKTPSRQTLSVVHIRQQPDVTPAGAMRQSQPPPLRKGQGLAGRVWKQKQPLSLGRLDPDRGSIHHRAAAELGLRSAFAFPILLAGEVLGVVELFARNSFQPTDRLLDIVAAVGIQIGQFMERTHALDRLRQSEEELIQVNNALEQRVRDRTAELHEANRELSAEIVERTRLEREIIRISEREQRRIGQDLHDGVCQELAAIAFMTRALATRLSRSGTPETERIIHVAHLLNDSISRTRDIARGLHPVEMDADGLMVALKDLALRTDQRIACSFRCKEPILMPESDVALNLYRIAQEAVNNALKYSRAKRIIVSLEREGAALRLSIADDGRGIPDQSVSRPLKRGGMGLHIMRYRARTMGATLRVNKRRPHGTEVICLLPRK
jgi:PAS domain S-box-containing protein